MFTMLNKKCISPVVATALLIVVSVVAVVGFQQWYSSYESIILSDTEKKSSSSIGNVGIEYISDEGIIYIINRGSVNVSINTIKIGNTDCNINQELKPGVNNISIGRCLLDIPQIENIEDIFLVVDDSIINEKFFIDEITISLEDLSTSIICSIDSDSDNYLSPVCASYPMTIYEFEGHLDASDNSFLVIADPTCWLKSDKTSCEINFLNNGCGSDTVLDIGTGLCWQKNAGSSGTKIWTDAIIYCETTLDGLGGHNDWRIPTRQELFSIRDLERVNPSIVGGNNNIFLSVASNYYWSMSTYWPSQAYVWGVHFGSGLDNNVGKGIARNVLCVRQI